MGSGLRIPRDEAHLRAASAADVYMRMCMNIIHLYHRTTSGQAREVADLLLAVRPSDRVGRSIRAMVRLSLDRGFCLGGFNPKNK